MSQPGPLSERLSAAAAGGGARAPRHRLLVVGTGGQGVLTAARCLGEAARASGLAVTLGQLHGMSQRGGAVESSVVIGAAECAFIADGCADVVLGLEPLESLRARPRMSSRTTVVTSISPIRPPGLARTGARYPATGEILLRLQEAAGRVVAVDGAALARAARAPRALNVVMLGVLAGQVELPFGAAALFSAIAGSGHGTAAEPDRRAFQIGVEAVPA